MNREQQLRQAVEGATDAYVVTLSVTDFEKTPGTRLCDITFEELELTDVVALSMVLPPFTLTAEIVADRALISIWWYE